MMSANDLASALLEYGIKAERKSIYADIEALQYYGMDIVQQKGSNPGYYVASRIFELPELKLLVDAVQSSKFITTKKDISQTHIVMGYPTENIYSKNAPAISVLTFILGGGMSSRLFVRIREKLGLVYSINATPELFDIAGNIVISLATNHTNQELALTAIREEIDNIANNGVTDAELQKAKTFCKSMIVMSSETTINIARHNAANTMQFGTYKTVDQRIDEIENVSLEQVNGLAKEIFTSQNYCMAIVSDKPNKEGMNIYSKQTKK